MKRASLFFAAVIMVFQMASWVWASPTTASDAGRAVRGWLGTGPRPLGTALGSQIGNIETFTDNSGSPAYYIVNLQPSGFVIVAADDDVEPIMGFVKDGVYDTSPENPLADLVKNDSKARIATVRDVTRPVSPDEVGRRQNNRAKWSVFEELAGERGHARGQGRPDKPGVASLPAIDDCRIAPLLETNWAQGDVAGTCYNYYTPNHYLCGCVATAAAQLMRYHQYPTSGIGVHSFSITIDNNPPANWNTRGGDGSGGAYVWENMVASPDLYTTQAQRQAIGALCYDAGLTVNMHYTSGDSIANTLDLADALTGTFGYTNAIKGYNNGNEMGAPLTAMINPNLDAGDPVLLGITGSSGGHAIVCDGYGFNNSTLYHHLNLGWNETANDAWYNLPSIITTNPNCSYTIIYKCVYNIRPTAGGDGEVISGRIFDPCGVPLANPFLYAEPVGQPMLVPFSKSWDNGIYAFDNLDSNKTYSVRPFVTGYVFTAQNATTGASTNNTTTVGNVSGLDFYGERLEITDITPGSGPKGSYIKIEGENFGDSAGYVIFAGGDWGEEVQWSDSVILCRVPANAQTGAVKIATAESDLSFGMNFQVTSPNTVYVDDEPNDIQDGTAANPLDNIQTAMTAVAENGTVIVNPGLYYENLDFNGRGITVTGSAPEDSDIVASTVVDGNGLGVVVRFDSGEDANSVLAGLSIQGGYSQWDGGGIYCEHSSPTIRYCIIRDNSTDGYNGAGIRLYDRSCPEISYCSITANHVAASLNGAGIACINDSNALITRCAISDNVAGYGGAGICVNTSTPVITDCLFSGNSLTDEYTYGGAMNNYDSSPVLTNCAFIDNSASWEGGAIFNNWDCCPTLIGCTFINNEAGESGGAMSNGSAKPRMVNCTFLGNRAGTRGGAINSSGANQALTITNCRFAGNAATKSGADGGAMYNSSSGPTITNCTFSDNFAKDKGGAIFNGGNNFGSNGNVAAKNCIFWGNSGTGQIYDEYSTTSVTYSGVQGGWAGAGNINSDPVFIDRGAWVDVNDANEIVGADDPNAVWVDGDYRLLYGSPCIDAGNNAAVPADAFDVDADANSTEPMPYDLDGYARIIDGDCNSTQIVDMGAYEFDFGRLGDCDGDCQVDSVDYGLLASAWLAEAGEGGYDERANIGRPHDDIVNGRDLAVMTEHWLAGK